MITIYYKNGQLNKYKTIKSLIKYYIECYKLGIKPGKINIPVDNLESF